MTLTHVPSIWIAHGLIQLAYNLLLSGLMTKREQVYPLAEDFRGQAWNSPLVKSSHMTLPRQGRGRGREYISYVLLHSKPPQSLARSSMTWQFTLDFAGLTHTSFGQILWLVD